MGGMNGNAGWVLQLIFTYEVEEKKLFPELFIAAPLYFQSLNSNFKASKQGSNRATPRYDTVIMTKPTSSLLIITQRDAVCTHTLFFPLSLQPASIFLMIQPPTYNRTHLSLHTACGNSLRSSAESRTQLTCTADLAHALPCPALPCICPKTRTALLYGNMIMGVQDFPTGPLNHIHSASPFAGALPIDYHHTHAYKPPVNHSSESRRLQIPE